MKFTLILPQSQIKPAFDEVIKQASNDITVKGFRKGKAPKDLVEKQLDQEKIQEEVIRRLIPTAYADHIKEHDLKPISQPKISVKNIDPAGDWEFDVQIAQKPQVKLGDYQQKIISKIKPISKKKGNKDTASSKDSPDDDQKLLSDIFDTLLAAVEVKVPELLIEQEVNHRLSQLLEQVDKLGITLEEYLASIDKTVEAIRGDYKKTATERLKLEFILDEIAKAEKFNQIDEKFKEFIEQITDDKAKSQILSDRRQQEQIKYSLTRQQVIDHLKSLVKKPKNKK